MVNEIGPEAIRERTSRLTTQLVARLKEEGFRLRAPDDADRHASITMVELEDPAAVVQKLAERDIIVDSRLGAVRISPYFYNTPGDIEEQVTAMCEIRSSLKA